MKSKTSSLAFFVVIFIVSLTITGSTDTCQEYYDQTGCYATTYSSTCTDKDDENKEHQYASSTEPDPGEGCSDVEEDPEVN